MTDKVQKIREEIEKLHKEYRRKKGAFYYRKALRTVLFLIDTLQKEPVDYDKLNTMLDDALSKETKKNWNERLDKKEPVSNDFEMALAEMIDKAQTSVVEPLVVAAQWKDELIKLAKNEEPVSVWHDAKDTPVASKTKIVLYTNGKWDMFKAYETKDDYDNYWAGVNQTLEEKGVLVKRWAYVEDLLKL